MIPISELDHRICVLQKKLQSQHLDGALLAHNISKFYYSGTMQCQYVYVPANGNALGLIRKNMERANLESGIPLVQMGNFSGLNGLLAEAGFAPASLGLELDVLPATIYLRLLNVFSGVKFTDCSTVVREARQVKSLYELEQFTRAAEQVDALHKQVPRLLWEGKNELEFAAECEAILRGLGHQGFTRVRGFNQEMFYGHILSGESGAMASYLDSPTGGTGVSPAAAQGVGQRKIGLGEPITVDYAGIYSGYIVDQTRLYSLGSLPDTLMYAFEAALVMQQLLVPLLTPGITGGEIYAAALASAKKAGLENHFMGVGDTQAKFVGHGVGLEFDEFPILAKGSTHMLEENMVIAVEPKFTFHGLGVVGIENTYHIQKEKARKISITPDNHVIV